jgi:hypothetical protein
MGVRDNKTKFAKDFFSFSLAFFFEKQNSDSTTGKSDRDPRQPLAENSIRLHLPNQRRQLLHQQIRENTVM